MSQCETHAHAHHSCADCAVRDLALCAALSDAELERLNKIGHKQRYAKGETILWSGEESPVFANIVSGVLKLATTTADGREQIVGLLFPADFIGRLFAVKTEYDVTAITEVELCVFPRAGFERALEDYIALERDLLRRTLDELDSTRQWMVLLGRKSAEEKVASFLVQIARRLHSETARTHKPFSFDMPLTRAQIADVLGLTIETVSRQMTKLKSAGVIALPTARSIEILRPDILQHMAEAA